MTVATTKADNLWERFTQDRSLENKNNLVIHYLFLVKAIVYRLMPTYKDYSEFDDLLSCGVLGLIDAIDKYAIKRGVKFEYYAAMRIRGEIIDHMRKQDWAPSSLRRKIQSIANAYSELEVQLHRTPTDAEVAAHLDMDEEKMLQIIEKAHMFNVLHFEELLSDENAGGEFQVQDKAETPEEQITNQEMKRILGDIIDMLPEKEKLVITLYYYEELTFKEIAGILNVSESRVSQIHAKVIMKLKTKLQRQFT